MIRVLKKINVLLSWEQKKKVLLIVILMILGGFLETIGVSLIVPIMTSIMQENFYTNNRYARFFCNIVGINNQNTFMILLLIVLIIVFIIKNVYLLFEVYIQMDFICRSRQYTQARLMRAFMYRPYEYYLETSIGEMQRIIVSDSYGAYNLLNVLMSFMTEFMVSVCLVVAIFIIEPMMSSLITIALAVEMFIIYRIIKPIVRKATLTRMDAASNTGKWIIQALSGIKDVKINRKEDYFTEQYSKYAKIDALQEKKTNVFGSMPRLIIESLTMAVVLGIVVIMLIKGNSITGLIPQISAFAVAAVRLLPSVNRMSIAIGNIATNEPALDSTIDTLKIINDIESKEKVKDKYVFSEKLTLNEKCEIIGLTFGYPQSERLVFKNASMEIPVGKSVGIVGTTGSGKTTVVDILIGLLKVDSGEVLTDGVSIKGRESEWLSYVSYVPQNIYMIDDTIRANVAFGEKETVINDNDVWYALKEAKIDDFVRSLPRGLDTTIGDRGVRLSGGQRQRLGIARALYSKPELLIFDEATSALDNETELAIMESINSLRGKTTMIIIAHRLTTISECDLVYRVGDGKIILEK